MKDTDPKAQARFIGLLMKKSGQERMKLGFSMFDMVQSQVVASIKMANPYADRNEIRKWIFLRFYGQEFSLDAQRRILSKI